MFQFFYILPQVSDYKRSHCMFIWRLPSNSCFLSEMEQGFHKQIWYLFYEIKTKSCLSASAWNNCCLLVCFVGDVEPSAECRAPSGDAEGDGPGALVPTSNLSENNKQLSASQGSLRSIDNDSSATMSADEGQAANVQSLFHLCRKSFWLFQPPAYWLFVV